MTDGQPDTAQDQPKPDAGTAPTQANNQPEEKPGGDGGGAEVKDTPKGDEGANDGQGGAADPTPAPLALTLPEGSRLRESDLVQITAEATAAGLTQDQAQKLVNARTEQLAQTADRFRAELEADPVMGGDKFQATMALAVKGRDLAAPPGTEEAAFINDLFETGLGNHKMLVRIFARLGKMVAEDSPVNAGGLSNGGQQKRAPEEVLYGGK